MRLTELACEVNDLSRQQQESLLIGNPRFLRQGERQLIMSHNTGYLETNMLLYIRYH